MIPWCHTDNIASARVALKAIYSHYSGDLAVNQYLRDHCLHLLEAPTGDTGIPTDDFNPSHWTPSYKSQLTNTLSKVALKGFDYQTGTYALYSVPSGDFYIGSTTNIVTRFMNHYSDSRDPFLSHRLLYSEINAVGGFNNFLLDMVVGTPDHYLKFVQANLDYAGDTELWRSLQLFTQYEARIYEQAVQTWLSPSLNGPGNITFTTQWDPNDIRFTKLGERPFIVTPADGSSSFTLPSLNAGSEVLGISRKTISTVINYPDTFVECPGIGISCSFSEPHMPALEENPYPNVYHQPTIEGFDF